MMTNPRYPNVYVELLGRNGNTGSIMAIVAEAMRKAGIASDEIMAFRLAVMDCDSYDAVLRLVMETVSVGRAEDYE